MNKKMWVWRLALPNRVDALMLVMAVLLSVGYFYSLMVGMMFDPETLTMVCMWPAICVLIGVGCGLGWNCFSWNRLLILTLVTLVSPFLAALLSWIFGWKMIDEATIGLGQMWRGSYGGEPERPIDAEWYLWLAGGFVGVLLASWLIVLLFRNIPYLLFAVVKRVIENAGDRFKMTRVNLMIGVAVILFCITMLNNILIANGLNVFDGGGRTPDAAIEIVISAIAGLVWFGVVAYWPSWGILKSENRWAMFWAIGTIVSLPCVFWNIRWFSGGAQLPLWLELTFLALCCLLFVLTLFGIKKVGEKAFPTFWSIVPFAFSAVVVTSPAFVDYSIFMNPYLQVSFKDRTLLSLESGNLMWRTNGQIRGFAGNYVCTFDSNSRPDLLAWLDLEATPVSLTFVNLQPDIKTGMLDGVSKSTVSIIDGSVNAKQFADVIADASHVYVVNVDFDRAKSQAVESAAMIYASFEQPDNLTKFLKLIKELKDGSKVRIDSAIHTEHLIAMKKVNANCELSLFGELLVDNFDWTKYKDSFRNVVLHTGYNYYESDVTQNQFRCLLETQVQIVPGYAADKQLAWDLVFAFPGRVRTGEFINHSTLDDLEDIHLVWGKNSNDEITHLFLPDIHFMDEPGKFGALKSLSFDFNWLDETDLALGKSITDVGPLKDLIHLEELYLANSPLIVTDMGFLANLTQLKHLQVPNVDRSTPGTVGFDCCPSLESITFLGKPDNVTISELAKLRKLKKVTISDVNNAGLQKEIAQSALEQKLPRVEIEVMPFGKHRVQIPESFRKHREDTREKVLAKLKERLGVQ